MHFNLILQDETSMSTTDEKISNKALTHQNVAMQPQIYVCDAAAIWVANCVNQARATLSLFGAKYSVSNILEPVSRGESLLRSRPCPCEQLHPPSD